MKKTSVLLTILLCASVARADDLVGWQKELISTGGARIRTIVLDQKKNETCLIGTEDGLFMSSRKPDARTEIPAFLLKGAINAIYIKEDNRILAATDTGAFESKDKGKTWGAIFEGTPALSIVAFNQEILLGTAEGLYFKRPGENVFTRIPGEAGRSACLDIKLSSHEIYSLGNDRLFFIDPQTKAAEIIFSSTSADEATTDETNTQENEKETSPRNLRAIEIAEGALYLASIKGIFVSKDKGRNWREISSDGLPLYEVTRLIALEGNALCAGTGRGLFCKLNERWVKTDSGFSNEEVSDFAIARNKDFIVATPEGLYTLRGADANKLAALAGEAPAGDCQFTEYAELEKKFEQEPTIQDVHELAVRYADVDKKKIDSWHKQSRMRAVIPSVSVGIDRNATELFHWDTGPNPDVLARGKEYRDWDVSMSWDLGDLIWSSNQTSIDSRSKMMTELRQIVIDQVTRIYFERRRLQIEIVSCQYPSTGEKMAAQMRVHELTSLIDGYTGGEFTRRLNRQSNT
jgi:hypothetical protein